MGIWKPPLVVVTLGVVYIGVTVVGGGLTVLVPGITVLSTLVVVGVTKRVVVGVAVPTMDVPPVDEHKAFPAASR